MSSKKDSVDSVARQAFNAMARALVRAGASLKTVLSPLSPWHAGRAHHEGLQMGAGINPFKDDPKIK